MMPRMFDSRPMGMLTNAALWFSLDLKSTKKYRKKTPPLLFLE